MTYLLDTCVISDLRKAVPETVKAWFQTKDQDFFCISAVTIAELLDGIERLPQSEKRKNLELWFYGDVQTRFKDRIFPIDEHVARKWGTLSAKIRKHGIAMSTQDLYIAATAEVHDLVLLTRNVKDFSSLNIHVFDPWSDAG